MTKQQILEALSKWIKQRPGLEFGNYGEMKSYRAELRQIAKDRRDAETLLRAVALRPSITAEDLIAATRAYSGRLQIKEATDQRREGCSNDCKGRVCKNALRCDGHAPIRIDYCAGQYWPTEYRKAVCAVLASALWDALREDFSSVPDKPELSKGDAIRLNFRREFGRSIAQRWFN